MRTHSLRKHTKNIPLDLVASLARLCGGRDQDGQGLTRCVVRPEPLGIP